MQLKKKETSSCNKMSPIGLFQCDSKLNLHLIYSKKNPDYLGTKIAFDIYRKEVING